ncbi:MAG: flagellar export protein FliJ [Deltaproteobacteria bacterium]|jgi:flagellar FliJ protein|nr:flagellar export protein FliJ [Deltaproteobacteria bacterium]
MPAFKFRLEFLISLRKRKEEEAAAILAKRLNSIAQLEKRIDEDHQALNHAAEEISELGAKGRLTGPLLLLFSNYQEKLRKDIKKSLELLALSRREEAKERLALKKAVIDRQIMEKIKDKNKQAWIEEDFRKEQANLEELASLARARCGANNDATSNDSEKY